MPRLWAERLAKRIPRIIQSLDKMDERGMGENPHYGKLLTELASSYENLATASAQAKRDLETAKMEATQARKRLASARDELKREQAAFYKERDEARAAAKRGEADIARRSADIEAERQSLTLERDKAIALQRKCETFIDQATRAAAQL